MDSLTVFAVFYLFIFNVTPSSLTQWDTKRKCEISNPPGMENWRPHTHMHMTGHCEGIPWAYGSCRGAGQDKGGGELSNLLKGWMIKPLFENPNCTSAWPWIESYTHLSIDHSLYSIYSLLQHILWKRVYVWHSGFVLQPRFYTGHPVACKFISFRSKNVFKIKQ